MFIDFQSQRHHNLAFLFKQWAFHILISITAFYLVTYVLRGNFSFPPYFLIGFLFITTWIDLARQDRINKISIDSSNGFIHFNYYDINEGQVKKTFSFGETRIKITRSEIYFFAGRKETFIISKTKDGFDKRTLREIRETLENLTSPV